MSTPAELTPEQQERVDCVMDELRRFSEEHVIGQPAVELTVKSVEEAFRHYYKALGAEEVHVNARIAWACGGRDGDQSCKFTGPIEAPIRWWRSPRRWLRLKIRRSPAYCHVHGRHLDQVVLADTWARWPAEERIFNTVKIR